MFKNICKYIELALSFLLLGTTIYQSIIGGRLFLLVSLLFLIETVIYSLALFSKTLKIPSLIQFIHSPLAMVVLLISVVLNGEAKYSILLIIIASIYIFLKIGIIIYYYLDHKKKNDVISYAKFYNGLCSLLYVINLLIVVIFKNIAIEVTALTFLLILIILNALSTFAVAYFALAYLVTAYSLKTLSFKEKITAVSRFFIKYELGFIISEIFCFTAMIVSFINVSKNQFFFYLGMFYSIIFTARLITFLWNKSLEKKETNPLLLSKKKHGILLFNSLFFLAAGELLSITSILLSALKASLNIPAWFFVGFMFPFSILSFVLSMIHRKSAKTIDNAYLDVTVDQSLITSLFSFLAGLSYFFKYIPNNDLSGLLWLILWLGVLTIIIVALIVSFVHSLMGLKGKRGTQKNSPDIVSEL